jgi:hypothetical protein
MNKFLIAGAVSLAALTAAYYSLSASTHPKDTVRRTAIEAVGGYYNIWLPPPEFDKPYPGALTIWYGYSPAGLLIVCQKVALACAQRTSKNSCDIHIIDETFFPKFKESYSVLLRHELGHCNGWPGTHPNSTLNRVFHEVDVQLPSNTKWVRAHWCRTPDGEGKELCSRKLG